MPTARLLTPDDADAYVTLRREMLLDSPWAFGASVGFDRGSDPVLVRGSLAKADYAILAVEEGGRMVATAGVVRDERPKRHHIVTVWAVYVTPTARGRGLGRAVVAATIDAARGWAGVEVVLLTVSENAPAARKLYESLGFVAWGTEPDALRVDGKRYAETYMRLVL